MIIKNPKTWQKVASLGGLAYILGSIFKANSRIFIFGSTAHCMGLSLVPH
jgi:hypothetical protein